MAVIGGSANMVTSKTKCGGNIGRNFKKAKHFRVEDDLANG